jgi:hypothetical protein
MITNSTSWSHRSTLNERPAPIGWFEPSFPGQPCDPPLSRSAFASRVASIPFPSNLSRHPAPRLLPLPPIPTKLPDLLRFPPKFYSKYPKLSRLSSLPNSCSFVQFVSHSPSPPDPTSTTKQRETTGGIRSPQSPRKTPSSSALSTKILLAKKPNSYASTSPPSVPTPLSPPRAVHPGLRNFERAYQPAVNAWAKYNNIGRKPILAGIGRKHRAGAFESERWHLYRGEAPSYCGADERCARFRRRS